jgi:CheY-like chemotaxis protein
MPRLLVVEDDDDVREAYRCFFANEGYSVRAVRCAEEALEVIREEVPDAMLIDLLLPGMDGAELCRTVRARDELAAVRLVLVTCAPRGFGLDLSMIDEAWAPADLVLDKMIPLDDLLSMIRDLEGKAAEDRAAPPAAEPAPQPAAPAPPTRRPFSMDALREMLPPEDPIPAEDVFILLGRIQDTFGRVPAAAVRELSRRSGMPEARLYGALTAYRGFAVEEEVRS